MFERVVNLRGKLKEIRGIDVNPQYVELKKKICIILKKYHEAINEDIVCHFRMPK